MGNSSSKQTELQKSLEVSLAEMHEADRTAVSLFLQKISSDQKFVTAAAFRDLNSANGFFDRKDALERIWDAFLSLYISSEQVMKETQPCRRERRFSNPFVNISELQSLSHPTKDHHLDYYLFANCFVAWYKNSRYEIEFLYLHLMHQESLVDSLFYYLTLALNLYSDSLAYSETSTKKLVEYLLAQAKIGGKSREGERNLISFDSPMRTAFYAIIYSLLIEPILKENREEIRSPYETMVRCPLFCSHVELLNRQVNSYQLSDMLDFAF